MFTWNKDDRYQIVIEDIEFVCDSIQDDYKLTYVDQKFDVVHVIMQPRINIW